MSLQGWSTLTNSTDTTFENARTQLVAGNVGARFAQQSERAGLLCAALVLRLAMWSVSVTIISTPCPAATTIASQPDQAGLLC